MMDEKKETVTIITVSLRQSEIERILIDWLDDRHDTKFAFNFDFDNDGVTVEIVRTRKEE